MKILKQNRPKGQLSFLEVKTFGWFTIIGYTLQNTLDDHTLKISLFLQGLLYQVGPYQFFWQPHNPLVGSSTNL